MSDLGFSMCRHEIGGKYNKVLMVGRSWAGLAGSPGSLHCLTFLHHHSPPPRIGLEELIIVRL